MFGTEEVLALLRAHGLAIVAFLSLIEGPIVSVIAGYLAKLGYFAFAALVPVLIVGDLLGDIGFYALGRYGYHRIPDWLLRRLGLRKGSMRALRGQFARRGGRILTVGKLTHAAGAAVLVSAGAARMPVLPFLFYNAAATVPKTAFFVALGAVFGQAHEAISVWIGRTTLGLLALILVAAGVWFWLARRSR